MATSSDDPPSSTGEKPQNPGFYLFTVLYFQLGFSDFCSMLVKFNEELKFYRFLSLFREGEVNFVVNPSSGAVC